MIDITGRIICINNLNDKVAQVVIKKKIDGKVVAIAIDIFGIFKKKMEDMKLRKNDKIYGVLHLKSNLYKGKYYTDVFFKDIDKIVDKPKNAVIYDNEVSLFENHNLIDENGKILL
jgi:hypothetical protein